MIICSTKFQTALSSAPLATRLRPICWSWRRPYSVAVPNWGEQSAQKPFPVIFPSYLWELISLRWTLAVSWLPLSLKNELFVDCFVIKSPPLWAPKSIESGRGGKTKPKINDTFHVCVCVTTFQLWNLIKLTSKEEELDALPGHSWHGGWLAHRFVKMGQSAKTSTFPRRGLVYFRLRQLFCSTLACTTLISGEWTSVSVRAAYNKRCCVHGNGAVMNMKQFHFPFCKSWT